MKKFAGLFYFVYLICIENNLLGIYALKLGG